MSENERIRTYMQRATELRALAARLKTDDARRLLLATAEEFAALAAAVAIASQAHGTKVPGGAPPRAHDHRVP